MNHPPWFFQGGINQIYSWPWDFKALSSYILHFLPAPCVMFTTFLMATLQVAMCLGCRCSKPCSFSAFSVVFSCEARKRPARSRGSCRSCGKIHREGGFGRSKAVSRTPSCSRGEYSYHGIWENMKLYSQFKINPHIHDPMMLHFSGGWFDTSSGRSHFLNKNHLRCF